MAAARPDAPHIRDLWPTPFFIISCLLQTTEQIRDSTTNSVTHTLCDLTRRLAAWGCCKNQSSRKPNWKKENSTWWTLGRDEFNDGANALRSADTRCATHLPRACLKVLLVTILIRRAAKR